MKLFVGAIIARDKDGRLSTNSMDVPAVDRKAADQAAWQRAVKLNLVNEAATVEFWTILHEVTEERLKEAGYVKPIIIGGDRDDVQN